MLKHTLYLVKNKDIDIIKIQIYKDSKSSWNLDLDFQLPALLRKLCYKSKTYLFQLIIILKQFKQVYQITYLNQLKQNIKGTNANFALILQLCSKIKTLKLIKTKYKRYKCQFCSNSLTLLQNQDTHTKINYNTSFFKSKRKQKRYKCSFYYVSINQNSKVYYYTSFELGASKKFQQNVGSAVPHFNQRQTNTLKKVFHCNKKETKQKNQSAQIQSPYPSCHPLHSIITQRNTTILYLLLQTSAAIIRVLKLNAGKKKKIRTE
eukprot:TRINITY_DN1492_c1_g1_i6.p1 TRINITY_DN1492_c1_g1~~TRINITY_DN1492_c1_g1_i6.p1  ORF type:complete len:263 (+),score=-10.17 TRINITY_DN1492_c1_g1_i6:367-1155(+)